MITVMIIAELVIIGNVNQQWITDIKASISTEALVKCFIARVSAESSAEMFHSLNQYWQKSVLTEQLPDAQRSHAESLTDIGDSYPAYYHGNSIITRYHGYKAPALQHTGICECHHVTAVACVVWSSTTSLYRY